MRPRGLDRPPSTATRHTREGVELSVRRRRCCAEIREPGTERWARTDGASGLFARKVSTALAMDAALHQRSSASPNTTRTAKRRLETLDAHATPQARCCLGNGVGCLPSGTRIAFLGDSVMRYEYMDMVMTLQGLDHLKSRREKNPLEESTWTSWQDYHIGTNQLLRPHEYCDCYRYEPMVNRSRPSGKVFHPSSTVEIRRYERPDCNISVGFMSTAATSYPKGHELPFRQWRPWNDSTFSLYPLWRSKSWKDTLSRHVSRALDPNVLVMAHTGSVAWKDPHELRVAARTAMPSACLVLKIEPPSFGLRRPDEARAREAFKDDIVFDTPRILAKHLNLTCDKRMYFDPPRCLHFAAESRVDSTLNAALVRLLYRQCTHFTEHSQDSDSPMVEGSGSRLSL